MIYLKDTLEVEVNCVLRLGYRLEQARILTRFPRTEVYTLHHSMQIKYGLNYIPIHSASIKRWILEATKSNSAELKNT